jgi:hypothetical protein
MSENTNSILMTQAQYARHRNKRPIEALGSNSALARQPVYLHTGAIELPIAEHTTDADVTIDLTF